MDTDKTNPQKRSPFLLPALALWGWQAELLPWALGMGLLLEAARFSKLRFDIQQIDFNRLWNFTTLMFLGAILYLFLAREGFETMGSLVDPGSPAQRLEGARKVSQTAIDFLRWIPFILYPFMLAYTWSRTVSLPWFTFSLYEQSRAKRVPESKAPAWASRRVEPANSYLVMVLFASCTATIHPKAYLPLFLVVATLALWPWRNPRYGPLAWAGLLVLLVGTAVVARQSLSVVRAAWMAMENRLMQGSGGDNFDQVRSATRLGVVGRLKQSGRIVLRIKTQDDGAPGLLREASFNIFRNDIWGSAHRNFEPAIMSEVDGIWQLAPSHDEGRFMTISRFSSEGEVSLTLPPNTQSISNAPSAIIQTNYMASTRSENTPVLTVYTVKHGRGGGFEGAPEPEDTDLETLRNGDREAIEETALHLGLHEQNPRQAIQTVERFLLGNFEYTLWQKERPDTTNKTALSYFLRESHRGHCEYFASATTLLLRTAGIPTRYAVGYSPSRQSGATWLARGRDAHAWCMAYVEGQWLEVDTTPGSWRDREAALAGWWEIVADWFSYVRFRFVTWRQEGGNWRIVVFVMGILVLTWLGWRQLRGSRWRRSRKASLETHSASTAPLGLDSEFFSVFQMLELTHGSRLPHETPLAWIQRLNIMSTTHATPLKEAIRLHNRLRFDPRGLSQPDRLRLRQLTSELNASEIKTNQE